VGIQVWHFFFKSKICLQWRKTSKHRVLDRVYWGSSTYPTHQWLENEETGSWGGQTAGLTKHSLLSCSKMTAERTLIILSFSASNAYQNTKIAKDKQMTSGKVREYSGSEQTTITFMVWQRHFPTLGQAAGCSEKLSHKERQIIAKKKCLLSTS